MQKNAAQTLLGNEISFNVGMAILTLICAASGIMPTVSAPIEPNELLSKMRDAYHKIESASLEIESKAPRVEALGIKMPIKVSYMKPNHVRIDVNLTNGKKMCSVADGKTVVVTNFESDPRKADVTETNAFGGFPLNLESMCFSQADKQLSTDKGCNMETSKLSVTEKDGWYILHEDATGQQVVVDYEIDKKTMLIMKTTVHVDGQKEALEYVVKKIDLKPKFAKDFFAFPDK